MAMKMILAWSLSLACVPAAVAQSASDVLARVNGVPIIRSQAMDLAWRQCGTVALNQLADDIIVKQAAEAAGIVPDAEEVRARVERVQAAAGGLPSPDLRARVEEDIRRERLLMKFKGLSVSESRGKAFFEKSKGSLRPAAVRLRRILAADEKEARAHLAALHAGAYFARLARTVSRDAVTKESGGDLGFVSPGTLPPDIEKAVFALKVGEVSVPLASGDGVHLYKVEERREAAWPEVKADLMRALLEQEAAAAWPAYIRELREKARYETVKTGPRP